jgi:hypothetical protein
MGMLMVLGGCGGAGRGGGAAHHEASLIDMFHEPGSTLRGVARASLVNETTGERLTLVFMTTQQVEVQAGRAVYYLDAYAGEGREIVAVLVFAFAQAPAIRSYRSSPSEDDVWIGFSTGADFRGGDPGTTWSNVGGGNATLNITRREGRVLIGNFRGRLDRNDGAGYFRIEDGIVMLASL